MNKIYKLIISIIIMVLAYNLLAGLYQGFVEDYFQVNTRRASFLDTLWKVALIYPILIPWMWFFYRENILEYLGEKPWFWKEDFWLAQGFLIALFLFSEPLFLWINRGQYEFVWQSQWSEWILWSIPISIAILFQSTAEEFLFRGFFQHKLAEITQKRWVYIGLPALLWALPHQAIPKDDVLKAGIVMQMFVLGLILGDWTARAGSIRGPIIVHLLMNIFTMLIFGNSVRPTESYILYVYAADLSIAKQLGYLVMTSLAAIIGYFGFIKPQLREVYGSE